MTQRDVWILSIPSTCLTGGADPFYDPPSCGKFGSSQSWFGDTVDRAQGDIVTGDEELNQASSTSRRAVKFIWQM